VLDILQQEIQNSHHIKSQSVNKNRVIALGFITLLLAGVIAGLFFEREPTPLEFQPQMGVSIISPPVVLPDVSLIDQEGHPFTVDRFKGEWSLLFFGYTHCPDVCPTTLSNMNRVAKELKNTGLNYVFVTLDPKRDTPEKLKEYVHYFNPDFIGVSGDKSNIDRLAEAVGVIYDFEGDTSSERYNVNHYAAILVVDPKGRLRAHILPPHPTSKMVSVITKIRDYYGE
jgi:protein SCO1/2